MRVAVIAFMDAVEPGSPVPANNYSALPARVSVRISRNCKRRDVFVGRCYRTVVRGRPIESDTPTTAKNANIDADRIAVYRLVEGREISCRIKTYSSFSSATIHSLE